MNSSEKDGSGIKLAFRFILVQLVICLLIVVCTFIVFDRRMAEAALVGCMINVVASGYFAVVSLKLPKNASPGMILARFYVGEVGKFVIVAVCFGWVFKYLPELIKGRQAIMLFVAFLIAQLAFVVAPLVFEKDFN
ncbi:MAG: ATP synthase subunit I [Gammaproteobacteria bacterium]|nr:ATP synthase subunit I [Gammaproteobacteria bacterium]MBQ0839263.1 ATP synthase subunit I [Gammaproteobacteria bacterium]